MQNSIKQNDHQPLKLKKYTHVLLFVAKNYVFELLNLKNKQMYNIKYKKNIQNSISFRGRLHLLPWENNLSAYLIKKINNHNNGNT